MSNTDSVQAIDKEIQRSKEHVELATALERLRSNRDFKKIIVEGYLGQECVRLVLLKADSNLQAADKQASIMKQIDGVGALHQYFQTVDIRASMAEKSIASDEQERQLMLEEGL